MIELGWGKLYGTKFNSQVLELDARKGNQGYKQVFNLNLQGYYELKFDYAARAGHLA